MARPLRIEYEHAFYHVLNRGLERRVVFKDREDFHSFLNTITNLHPRFKFIVHSFCLMPNHYHLFIETPNANLSRIMKDLNSFYTQYFNRKYRRAGPLFQGRYKALLVDKDNYSLVLSRYIHLNPVKAGLVQNPEDYPHSSYRIFLRREKPPIFLETKWLLSQFDNSRMKMKAFTLDGSKGSWEPFKEARFSSLLGADEFVEKIKENFIPKSKDSTISKLRQIQRPNNIQFLEGEIQKFSKDPSLQKKLLVYYLKNKTTLYLKEIGQKVGGISGPAVCQIVRRLEKDRKKNKSLNDLIGQIEAAC